MKLKYCLLPVFLLALFSLKVKAQIENVIVETYYVSDLLDATDTIGGYLAPSSKTYRIYVDLAQGCKIKKIFGDTSHALRFSSTGIFFNHVDRGELYGSDMYISHLDEGTVGLDTYITLGQATKNATNTYYGILKPQDPDTSIIGGMHNDGGSAGILDGLISNQDAAAGIPVTLKDGMVVFGNPPSNQGGDGLDSTIFGPLNVDSELVTNNAYYVCSGATGADPISNQVLVAQLTTKGKISFELNIEVADSNGNIIIYTASGANSPSGDTIVSPYLKYPQACGCSDPHYLEYSNSYACNNQSECKTLIVYGCMDQNACNYDANANFNVQTLCCYPGFCNDRDLATVCPVLNTQRMRAARSKLYPNPAQDELTIEIPQGEEAQLHFSIYDTYGNMILNKDMGAISTPVFEKMDVSGLSSGLYMLRLYIGDNIFTRKFMKN